MQSHADSAMNMFGQLGHRAVAHDIDKNDIAEIRAKQQRHEREKADENGRYGQHDQRHPDDPGRLVRFGIMTVAMMIIMVVDFRVLVIPLLAPEDEEIKTE